MTDNVKVVDGKIVKQLIEQQLNLVQLNNLEAGDVATYYHKGYGDMVSFNGDASL